MKNLSMRILSSFLISCLYLLAGAALAADTVRLKNGREIRGEVVSYQNGEFIILRAPTGAPAGTRERMIVLAENVESIEFDAATPATPAASADGRTIVLDASQEVVATGVQVKRGEKVRITASGEMRFSDGRTSGPGGLDANESWPFPGERFGVLVAMVGGPESAIYHVIGENSEFEARKDGELYLQINARSLRGARGSYTARIQGGSAGSGTSGTPSAPAGARQLKYEREVPADKDWTDTGIDLLEGDTLQLTAEGTIHYTSSKTCGPQGGEREWGDLVRALPVNDVGRGALIGLVGQTGVAKPFFAGSSLRVEVTRTGRLFLGINDDNYQNNSGRFRVRVEIIPAGTRTP